MKIHVHSSQINLWLSARDTGNWASRPRASWPCSFLAGRRLFASFDRNGLADFAVDGGRGDQDCPSDELSAICADFMAPRVPAVHPARFVAVDQFISSK